MQNEGSLERWKVKTLSSLIYGRQQCWSYTVRRNSEVRGKWQSFQYIIGKTWSILLLNRMSGYTNASRNVLLKKISLQTKGLLKAYYFKVYNWLTLFVIIIVFIFPQPALLLCTWCVLLPSNGGAHSLILTLWTRQAARNRSGHRRPLLYSPSVIENTFCQDCTFGLVQESWWKSQMVPLAQNNKGNREQQKELKTILNAHFVNKATNVPFWSMTSGASSTKKNNKFRALVMLVKLCQNPRIGW